jgi:hypothetical protein
MTRTGIRSVLAPLAPLAIVITVDTTAAAAEVGKQRGAATAGRAASGRVERFGIRYPASSWRADCIRRPAGGWRCAVGHGRAVLGRGDYHWDECPPARGQGRRHVLRMRSARHTRRRVWRLGAPAVALLAGVATALAASHGAATHVGQARAVARAAVTTTAEGAVVATGDGPVPRSCVHRRELGPASRHVLAVTLTPSAPRRTRDALLHRPLVGTCDVPGEHVREFAGRWNPRFQQCGTVLFTNRLGVKIASAATSCSLYAGEAGATPDTAVFPRTPFRRVRIACCPFGQCALRIDRLVQGHSTP